MTRKWNVGRSWVAAGWRRAGGLFAGLLLVACSAAAPTVKTVPLATATATVLLSTTSAVTNPSVPSTVTSILPTATSVSAATATPVPPLSTAPSVPPTATVVPPLPTEVAPTGNLYRADFARWPQGEKSGQYPVRLAVDPATGEYRLVLTDLQGGYTYFLSAPDGPTVADFRLDIDARRVRGGERAAYGVTFREQTPQVGIMQGEHYFFSVAADGFFSLNLVQPNAATVVVSGRTSSPAIRSAGESNHLTVVCKGAEITLAINGQTVGAYSATLTGAGRIGVYAGTPPAGSAPIVTEAGFSNLVVSRVP